MVSGCLDPHHGRHDPRPRPRRVIDEIRSRERNGLLSKPQGLQPGDRIRITSGPFQDRVALYAGQAPHDRVAVLLQLLGSRQRTELPASAVEAVS
jgi:transcriptional antiterminator RfaH